MRRLFLSRPEYDGLVKHCPDWMVLRWGEYVKVWGINGVIVKGSIPSMENLQAQLDYAKLQA